MARRSLWLGALALALGTFATVTREIVGARAAGGADHAILFWFARHRSPWLTSMMIDVTALGSVTIVTLVTVLAFAILLAVRDGRGALQLAVASAGTSLRTLVAKSFIERSRPTEVEHLVNVSGFSYPSGHSLAAAALYLTIAIMAERHLRSGPFRVALMVGAIFLIVMVALSRVYLGVHYPSDVLSGVCLGAAWALILTGLFSIGASETEGKPP
jgi:undecaprenyl-diphosphatase